MSRLLAPSVCLYLLIVALPACAADQALADVLAKPILEDGTPQKEVEAFCAIRVLPLVQPASADEWTKTADLLRKETLEKVVFRGEAARWKELPLKIDWLEEIEGGPGYKIKKLRYEVLPGLWIPALLYVPDKLDGKQPAFMNVNGHDGAGKAAPYKQLRCINLAKRGMTVLNLEWFGMGQLRDGGFSHARMNQLDLCGTSGLAPFYLAMSRGLDVLLAQPNVDPARVGVAGLSGGGWQTIIISALDTRVTLCNPVAGYSSFTTRINNHSDLGDSEQTPVDLGATADYAHLTAMLAPRVALLTYNQADNCCFAAPHALPPLLEAARPIYKLLGKEANLHDHVNYDPGTHNFEQDNREALYRVVGQHFYPDLVKSRDQWSRFSQEIDSQSEVKKPEELNVELPPDNLDFHQVALRLMSGLPKQQSPPQAEETRAKWQPEARKALAAVVKYHAWKAKGQEAGKDEVAGVQVARWKVRIENEWTLPAVELSKGEPKGTTLVLADEGRGSTAEVVEKLIAEGQRVVVIDPFYLGENKIKSRDYLWGLFVSTVGQRPLGVQASQIAAACRWLKSERGGEVSVVSIGPRTSLMALTAAALEPEAITRLEMQRPLSSLKEIVRSNKAVTEAPEYFCFGLLERFDLPHLSAMVTPREVTTIP
ncbi:MAG TPA: acetylxylan esterase [Pirellulaceae bacterium]|nr:acetylxylan esterase [Pirellulaceae bacterium]